ncbi:MAG: aminoglycoside phosphotransferase family protein [Propionibacteriaceae bacterium]|jgi:hypothetical protein|nr:aminoglycoside phosphotransferase family protein [Propionibacteriaceae bacterium]
MSEIEVPSAVVEAFDFGGEVVDVAPLGQGRINGSFLISTRGGTRWPKYVLQRINTHVFVDPGALMDNIVAVTDYLKPGIAAEGGDPLRETLSVVKTRMGQSWWRDDDGSPWRAYLFVDGMVCHQSASSPQVFHDAGEAFGTFARRLDEFPVDVLHSTIASFHDTRVRLAGFLVAVDRDRVRRVSTCPAEIDAVLARRDQCARLMGLADAGQMPIRVTHNDTKLNNVLMDPADRRRACVIDLDTVMPGLAVHDFGDAIRYGANRTDEDDPDIDRVGLDRAMFEAFTIGWVRGFGPGLTPIEKANLVWGVRAMTLEQGMRFLTDYLDGDRYYGVAYPTQNLDRARNQFALLSDIESHLAQLEQIVADLV